MRRVRKVRMDRNEFLALPQAGPGGAERSLPPYRRVTFLPLTHQPTELSLQGTEVNNLEVPGETGARVHALRLLARWLVSSARKGALCGANKLPADPQNPVDVAPEPKVVSKLR